MKLSKQACAAFMMCLQRCLAEEIDILPLMTDLEFEDSPDGLVCLNPPTFKMPEEKKLPEPEFDLLA
jgi:hypothetical protein